MRLTYLVLAHHRLPRVAELVETLLYRDDTVVLHVDRKADRKEFDALEQRLRHHGRHVGYANRVDVRWGEYSMMEAVLNGLEVIGESGMDPDYVCLLSGADIPIKPLAALKRHLQEQRGVEFIESFENPSDFILGGWREERYLYYHLFNYRHQARLAYWGMRLQRFLGVRRNPPAPPRFGSQWWCLTWETCEKLLVLSRRKEMDRFFRRVCIPDEMMFQTLVREIVPEERIAGESLTFYQFNEWGKPLLLVEDHEPLLRNEPRFFARKVSGHAHGLRKRMLELARSSEEGSNFQGETGGLTFRQAYSSFRCSVRQGFVGRRRAWFYRDVELGDLEWNIKPYFIIVSADGGAARRLQERLNGLVGVCCHGRLFAGEEIDFEGAVEQVSTFTRRDLPRRDHAPASFFVEILHAEENRLMGFIITGEEFHAGLEVFLRDRNSRVVLIRERRKRAVARHLYRLRGEVEESRLPDAAFRAHEEDTQMLDRVEEILDEYRKTPFRLDAGEIDGMGGVELEVLAGFISVEWRGGVDRKRDAGEVVVGKALGELVSRGAFSGHGIPPRPEKKTAFGAHG